MIVGLVVLAATLLSLVFLALVFDVISVVPPKQEDRLTTHNAPVDVVDRV